MCAISVIFTKPTQSKQSPKRLKFASLLFTFGGFLKLQKQTQKFWVAFFNGNSNALNLSLNGLGYILGDFFTKSSGYPGWHTIYVTVLELAPDTAADA
jgi:hypothetical protein